MDIFIIVIFLILIILSFLNLPVIYKDDKNPKLMPHEWISVMLFLISIIGLGGYLIF